MKKLLLILICLFMSSQLSSEEFTVRKNLNKILKSLNKKGEFYSCSYDNKSYHESQGYISNPQKYSQDYYPVFKQIILVYTKERIGLIVSEPVPRWSSRIKYIFSKEEDNHFVLGDFYGEPLGFHFQSIYTNDGIYWDDKGDLDWEKVKIDPKRWDYDFENENTGTFPYLVFKNSKLKLSLNLNFIEDFYICKEMELLSKIQKKKIVRRFLSMDPRFTVKKYRSITGETYTNTPDRGIQYD